VVSDDGGGGCFARDLPIITRMFCENDPLSILIKNDGYTSKTQTTTNVCSVACLAVCAAEGDGARPPKRSPFQGTCDDAR